MVRHGRLYEFCTIFVFSLFNSHENEETFRKNRKNLLNWYAVHFSLFFTEGDSVVRCRDKMSLLRQLPRWQQIISFGKLEITCWYVSYCSSGVVVIYSLPFFEHIYFNQYISESLCFNHSFLELCIFLIYNEESSFVYAGEKRHGIFLEINDLCKRNHILWPFFLIW